MKELDNLNRFLEAQDRDYNEAFQEIKDGKKTGHWMWYIFPQIDGLGFSHTTKFYAIKNFEEATQYLNHPVLGLRLIEISTELINLKSANPVAIFGHIDSLKLKSSMTLFSSIQNTNPVFKQVLEQYYNGEIDQNTIRLLNNG